MELDAIKTITDELGERISRVVVGQDQAIRLLVVALLSEGHVLVEGVPGTGKTLLARTFSRLLDLQFKRIQFTPDLMPGDLIGSNLFDFQTSSFELVKGPIFTEILLADEINRTPPKTQAALLEAMQERHVTLDGTRHDLGDGFMVIATQNPIEQEGTYPLPEAQLDRFMFSIHIGYPSREQELAIAGRSPRMEVPAMDRVAAPEDFLRFVDLIEAVPVSDPVLGYAVALAAATRPGDPDASDFVKSYVGWGVGPRCTQHLVTAAKASALLDGRPAPEVRDVREMALPVLRHRIVPNYNALGEGLDAADIVRRLVETVDEPK